MNYISVAHHRDEYRAHAPVTPPTSTPATHASRRQPLRERLEQVVSPMMKRHYSRSRAAAQNSAERGQRQSMMLVFTFAR